MIDIWVKLFSDQFEIALKLTRMMFGFGVMERPPCIPAADQSKAAVPARADAPSASPVDEPSRNKGPDEKHFAAAVPKTEVETLREIERISGIAGEIPRRRTESRIDRGQAEAAVISGIISFLEFTDEGATIRQISENLKIDRKKILPLLKKLVREKKIEELLGRYCLLKS